MLTPRAEYHILLWSQEPPAVFSILTSAPRFLTPRQQNILAVIPALAVTFCLHRVSAVERVSSGPGWLPARLTQASSQVTTSPGISPSLPRPLIFKSHGSNEWSDIHRREGSKGRDNSINLKFLHEEVRPSLWLKLCQVSLSLFVFTRVPYPLLKC